MTPLSPRTARLLALILVLATFVRIRTESASVQVYDETRYTELARSLSVSAETRNLPLRGWGRNHPALAAYVTRASMELFGDTVRGSRMLHMGAGLLMILVVFFMARDGFGDAAALWAAGLFAFNEYIVDVSTRATSHAPFLLFVSIAIWSFSTFVRLERPAPLYAAAAAVALAFYCKEIAALLVPAFGLVLLLPAHRRWLRERHVYLAGAFLGLLLAPDMAWNFIHGGTAEHVTYADHLSRAGSLGISAHPSAFYARDAVRWLHPRLTGEEFLDALDEYRSTNSFLGPLLLALAALGFVSRRGERGARAFAVVFAFIFGFFSLITAGRPTKELDPASWAWVDMTLFPVVVLAGSWLADPVDRARRIGRGLTVLALAYGMWRTFATLAA